MLLSRMENHALSAVSVRGYGGNLTQGLTRFSLRTELQWSVAQRLPQAMFPAP